MAPETASAIFWDETVPMPQKKERLEAMPPSLERNRYLAMVARHEQGQELLRRKADIRAEAPDIRVVAYSGEKIIITRGDGLRGEIVDTASGVSYPERYIQELLDKGVWKSGSPPGMDVYDVLARVDWEAHRRRRTKVEVVRDASPVERARKRLAEWRRRGR